LEGLTVLNGLVGSLEKVSAVCVVYLTETSVRIVIKDSPDDIQVFAEITQARLFSEYRLESMGGNCILFEIGISNLGRALTSGRSAPLCQLKLTKRMGQPCLSFETRALEVDIVHDIPVKIMKSSEIQHYLAPEVPIPQVQLELPRGKSFRTVVDRVKGINKHVFIDTDMGGTLTFRVEADSATIKTFYTNLTPRFGSNEDKQQSKNNKACVKVDTKKLATVLSYHTTAYESAILCVIENICLVLHVFLAPRGAGTVTYYIPVLQTGPFEF